MKDLLSLSRELDKSTCMDLRCKLAEEMKPLIGSHADEFEAKFCALIDAYPEFPWAAEMTARAMRLIPPDCSVQIGHNRFGAFGCGCSYQGIDRIVDCGEHSKATEVQPLRTRPSDLRTGDRSEVIGIAKQLLAAADACADSAALAARRARSLLAELEGIASSRSGG